MIAYNHFCVIIRTVKSLFTFIYNVLERHFNNGHKKKPPYY